MDVAKLACNTAQRNRDLEGMLLESWLIEDDSALSKELRSRGEAYTRRRPRAREPTTRWGRRTSTSTRAS